MATGKKLDDLHVNNQIQVHNGGTITNANTDLNITATSDDLLLNAQDDVFIQSNGGSSYKTITLANDGNTTFPGSIFLPQGAYDYHNNIVKMYPLLFPCLICLLGIEFQQPLYEKWG